jgi:diacylglycerol O-acyltransferase / wax synthase
MSATLPETNEEAWALAAQWSSQREMSAFEALMWRIETDPRLRSPMTVVDLLDRVPDWDRLRAAHDWASRLIPRFRQRVQEPALGIGVPTWLDDADFDLDYHLQRVALPPPGTRRQLLDMAQAEAMTPFDRARPPWRAVLFEGLEGGRAAYLLKVHHSMTDGQGGIQLIGLLHSRKRAPSPEKMAPPARPGEDVGAIGVLAEQVAHAPAAAVRGVRDTLGVGGRLARRPWNGVRAAAHFAGSLERVLAPPPAEPSPLLKARSLSWHFDALEVSLDDLKRAGKAAGGSLNDAYIAALLGGLRRYHDELGSPVDSLPMAMPISLRSGDHPMGGNRFAGVRFAAPTGVEDPAERIQAIHEFVLDVRDEPALDALGFAAPLLNRLPTAVVARWYAGQTANLDLQASNVAGLPWEAYIAGARIERMLPFGPVPGCALMVTLLSYAGTCCIGVNMDAAAVTEPDLLMTCLREGLDEVLALDTERKD